MRRGGRIMMIFGLVLGIITAVATLILLRTARPVAPEEVATPVPLQPVVVAFQLIEPYQQIPPDAIGIREWPADAVAALTDVVTDVTTVANKLASSRIYPGQVILAPMLIDKELEEQRLGLGSNPAQIIPEGMVAYSLPIDEISGVGGTIRDGDRVDIMASYQVEEDLAVQLVAQNVLVLKVGSWVDPSADGERADGGSAGVITFIVSPQEALILKKIKDDSAGIDLALRAINDNTIRELDAVGDRFILEELRFRPE